MIIRMTGLDLDMPYRITVSRHLDNALTIWLFYYKVKHSQYIREFGSTEPMIRIFDNTLSIILIILTALHLVRSDIGLRLKVGVAGSE